MADSEAGPGPASHADDSPRLCHSTPAHTGLALPVGQAALTVGSAWPSCINPQLKQGTASYVTFFPNFNIFSETTHNLPSIKSCFSILRSSEVTGGVGIMEGLVEGLKKQVETGPHNARALRKKHKANSLNEFENINWNFMRIKRGEGNKCFKTVTERKSNTFPSKSVPSAQTASLGGGAGACQFAHQRPHSYNREPVFGLAREEKEFSLSSPFPLQWLWTPFS